MISVIIVTRNRQEKLLRCIRSLLQNNNVHFEVLIIDQSDDTHLSRQILQHVNHQNIRYFFYPHNNVSQAKNFGIHHAKGSILAFTDDDCIVTHQWITNVDRFYISHPWVDGVFGATLPFSPKTHPKENCPSIFTPNSYKEMHVPATHWKYVGIGNNMSFRSRTIANHGLFKEWLSYGSQGGPSEDGEMILRLLIQGCTLAQNPHAVIYHDRWVSGREAFMVQQEYYRANIVCYGYFHFQHFSFARKTLQHELRGYLTAQNPYPFKQKRGKFRRLTIAAQYVLRLSIVAESLLMALLYARFNPVSKSVNSLPRRTS